jgi:IS1 family transposase
MILAWHLGKRDGTDAMLFTSKLAGATANRFQLTTDGFHGYKPAVPAVFGNDIDYAMMVKIYGADPNAERKYSPAICIDAQVDVRIGEPNPALICTSHIERQNLTMRMTIRRLTRLTNAFSKKWDNHEAALALYFAFYNACRVHSTLKQTPMMEAGLTDHIWSVQELLEMVA